MTKYTIEWSVFDNHEFTSILTEYKPHILDYLSQMMKPNALLCCPSFENFYEKTYGGLTLSRPHGSNRAFYIHNSDNSVLAVKGTEPCSPEIL